MITMISHAKPGGNVPGWAQKTAVNALAPIEPFKIFHKINENVKRNQPKLRDHRKILFCNYEAMRCILRYCY